MNTYQDTYYRVDHALSPRLHLTPVSQSTIDVWKEYIDQSSGKAYYYNQITRETQWEKPSGYVGGLRRKVYRRSRRTNNRSKKVINRKSRSCKN